MTKPLPPIPFYSKKYCCQKKLTYKTEPQRVVEYLDTLDLHQYIGPHKSQEVVIIADSGYDDKKIQNAILAKEWHFIIALKSTRAVTEGKIIQEYVEGGGSLLIIEGASPGSSINQIAGLFNLHIRLHPDKEKIKKISLDLTNRFRTNLENNPAWIEGGQPLFCLQDMPIISFERKGKGFVLVFSDNYFFIKKIFIFAERELVTFQSTLITALINKDENLLKVFMSNFFKVGGLEHD